MSTRPCMFQQAAALAHCLRSLASGDQGRLDCDEIVVSTSIMRDPRHTSWGLESAAWRCPSCRGSHFASLVASRSLKISDTVMPSHVNYPWLERAMGLLSRPGRPKNNHWGYLRVFKHTHPNLNAFLNITELFLRKIHEPELFI